MGLTAEQYKIAESNGISRSLAYNRYEYLFWDIEEAITKVPTTQDENNKEFLKWKDVAIANGFTYGTYYARTQKGMSPEMAATMPRQAAGANKHRGKEFVVYKGSSLICRGTIKECAEWMEIKESTFRYYLSGVYKKRIAERKTSDNCIKVYLVEDEEDGTN